MANEITRTASLQFAKGNVAAVAFSEASKNSNVSGTRYHRTVQQIGTSEEALGLGELASLGYCMIKNLDATNYVEIKTATSGTAFLKLKPGECALFRFGSGVTAPFAQANTAAVSIEIMIVED